MNLINLNKRGSALVIVMFVVMLLMVSGIGLLYISEQGRIFAIRTSEDMASRVCADAGVEMAVSEMNKRANSGSLKDSDLPRSIGETLPDMIGAFSYKVEKHDSNYFVYSVGARGDFRRTIEASLRKKSCFEYGILSKSSCYLPPNTTASAYDSQNAGATGLKIQMGTLSTAPTPTVVTKPGCVVNGDLFCGVGGDPSATISVDGTLTGKTYALTEEPEIYTPKIPLGLTAKPDLHTYGKTITFTDANSGIYGTISIDNGSGNYGKLVISGNVTLAVTNFMFLGEGAEIYVNEGSTLIMYLASNFITENSSSITYGGAVPDPSHIQIYGTRTGTPQIWTLKAKTSLCGVIYAPNANINLQAGKNMYGAIVGNSVNIDVQTGFSFYFDVNLLRATNLALGGGFRTNRWKETVSNGTSEWAY